ncbi:phosphoenolpyruvate--protein phosphotransferase [Salinicola halophilus]|uniref:phosphoenolpyruvate--protein phosphotransferase n=1 Tax=Salinicola halophilus TaxID=184065 RepID=UPI000DA1AA5E|nr:phosphoenolpyruvate--protein phosphotransferase [Salinicola halophilus]
MQASTQTLLAPMRGVVVPLDEVPDPVFAGAAMGPGIAIDPLDDTLHAPCEGEIVHCARTHHALTLRGTDGSEWLMHIGLDTVDLNGKGFEMRVTEGDRVAAGQALCRFDVDRLAQDATALITPLVLTNADGRQIEWRAAPGTIVELGAELLAVTLAADASEASPSVDADTTAPAAADASTREARVAASSGLHARPAARLRALAAEFAVEMTLSHGEREASVASLSGLLGLGLVQHDRVSVVVRGARAEAAAEAAVELLERAEPGEAARPSTDGRGSDHQNETVRQTAPGTLSGLPASPGLAVGRLRHFQRALPTVARDADDGAEERRALEAALLQVAEALDQSQRRARVRQQSAEAEIFEAHRAWLDDPELKIAAEARIDAGRSAGRAWFEALESEITRLEASKSAVLAARASDLRDLQRQVMQALSVDGEAVDEDVVGAILVARELTPSEFVAVAERIAGLCLAAGGTTSHVAILARARGVPCVVALGESLMTLEAGEVCLDADRATLEFTPDAERLAAFRAERTRREQTEREARENADAPAITQDGRHVHVLANVGSAAEAVTAAEAGAEGVGLMRSEFLFLAGDEAPSQQAQREVYAATVEAFGGRPVTVRLLDIGADKQLGYVTLPSVPNPALGERGVRLWHTLPALFETQLDALLEAAEAGARNAEGVPALRLMVPMVSDATELRFVRERLRERAERLGITQLPLLGAMVEVPSAALGAASLAREADFLSIGTNDLTQYALAMDREATALAARCDVLHPGVLKLIELCVQGAAGQCPVGVCGAAAGDPLAAAVLVALGVDELSVEPARVAGVKAELRKLDVAGVREALPSLMARDDAAGVRATLAALASQSTATP